MGFVGSRGVWVKSCRGSSGVSSGLTVVVETTVEPLTIFLVMVVPTKSYGLRTMCSCSVTKSQMCTGKKFQRQMTPRPLHLPSSRHVTASGTARGTALPSRIDTLNLYSSCRVRVTIG